MKNIWKKILGISLVLIMVLGCIPVQAASSQVYVPKTQSFTLYPGKDKKNTVTLGTCGGKITNLKSSNKKVAVPSRKFLKLYNGKIQSRIDLTLKKTGTTTISFKYKSRTYKAKVTVKKYVNPISSIKIGTTTVSRSKFNSRTTYTLKYSRFVNKKTPVKIKLAKGWKLDPNGFFYGQKGWKKSSALIQNGRSVKVKGGKGFRINFWALNTKTKQTEVFEIVFK